MSDIEADKRIFKPLPDKPITSLQTELLIDDTFRQHLSKLINSWLVDVDIPIVPWQHVLYTISLNLFGKSLKFDLDHTNTENRNIYLQTIPTNTPIESRFLTNVFHGTIVHEDEYCINFPIGGTIRMYGVDDENVSKSLFKLIKSLVYLINSLYLETYVMRDSHVKLVMAEESSKSNSLPTKPLTKKSKSHHNLSHEKSLSSSSTQIFGWLKKLTPQSLDHPKPTIHSLVEDGIRRGLSMTNINKKSTQSIISQHTSLYEDQPGDPHRFLKLKKRIENALISSSPNSYFPYPTLLNRLQVEEDMISEQKRILSLPVNENGFVKNETVSSNSQRRKSSFISSLSQTIKRSSLNSTNSEPTDVLLPQSATAYSSIRVPELLADSRKGLEFLLLDTTSLDGFNQHQTITISFTCYPIGCPDRACLGPIMSQMDYFRFKSPNDTVTIYPRIDQSLGDTIHHWYSQSQSSCRLHIDEQAQFIPGLLVETPAPLINTPKDTSRPDTLISEHDVYAKHSESSILTLPSPFYSKPSTDNSRHGSKFHGCNQPLLNHVFSFSHGIGSVNVYTNTELLCTMENKNRHITWISCSICDASTKPILLNDKAASYSFAKFLELLFYSTKLSLIEPFCSHTTHDNVNIKSILVRCFSFNGVTFKFMYEDTICYDLRLPRLQMAQISNADIISFTAPRLSILTLNEWKHTSAERDVDLFFQTIRAHLDLLNHYTIAENRRRIRAVEKNSAAVKQLQLESKMLDLEIKSLSKRLDTDHTAMLIVLADTNINELNDFRRYFAIQSDTILEYLMNWQTTYCNEVMDPCGWDRPDYIDSKSVHCFPGSSVLVREDEPTSIIAYTLSSNDYIQELLMDDGDDEEFSESTSSKTISIPSLSSTIESNRSAESPFPSPSNNSTSKLNINKPLPTPSPSPSNVIDGYYSSIERKYISPSTGTTSETASFRTMITEVVKSSVAEVSMNNSKRLEDLKARLSPWTKRQEETKLENVEGDLKRKLTERTLQPLNAVQQQQETKEVKVDSYFYETPEYPPRTKKSISPHIKHKFVHQGTEFTCIVYYAKEFEMLRRQCGIHQLIIQSLSRCQAWTATGGKSKSHFYKTQDDRFVIKEMMNAWNMAEKDAFLKFAPKYFKHIKKSADEPSILAKIFGFFTIRMKNVMDRKTILNLDLLVMEHLFYNQNIIKRFDFKGIQDRHVEEYRKQQNNITLWDGDWLNEYRTKLPVYEQSKAIMELAIEKDTEFLSKCNIMDYSLLVGIDQNKREMTIGIVDFIGTYTWYKKIESRSKSTLQPRKEVTIVPPDQYRNRFCREICEYFIPVPGKFDIVEPSKTLPSLLI